MTLSEKLLEFVAPGDDFVPHDHADPGTCPFCGGEHIQGKTPFVDLETEPGSPSTMSGPATTAGASGSWLSPTTA